MERISEHTGLIISYQLLIAVACTTQAARWKAARPEQLTCAHLYLDIAKSGYFFHAVGRVMDMPCGFCLTLFLWVCLSIQADRLSSLSSSSGYYMLSMLVLVFQATTGLSQGAGTFAGGVYTCSFRRDNTRSDMNMYYDTSPANEYFLLVARGTASSASKFCKASLYYYHPQRNIADMKYFRSLYTKCG